MSATPADVGAHIFEGGYRRYDGPRSGPAAAVRSLARYTVQRIMGLRRAARHKVLPFLSVIIAYLPAIAFIGILALVPKSANPQRFIPSYSEYYGFISAAILLFVIFSAPEALCPDRRHRSLSLYLASPLDRGSYLLSKVIAVFGVLLLVTTGPVVLLLIGYVLQNAGPDGPVEVMRTLLRIVAAGACMSAFYTALALGLSSLTDRRGLATGGALLVISGLHIVAGLLAFPMGLGESWELLSPISAPLELAQRWYGAQGIFPNIPTWALAAACAAWTALGSAFVWWRYRDLQVTR